MIETWFKLYRQIFDSWIFSDAHALKLWIWLIGRARIDDGYVQATIGKGETTVNLKRGQLLFGRLSAEEKLGIDASKIYRLLHQFKEKEMIELFPNNHFTIVTICNYDIYQSKRVQERTADEQPMNSHRTADEQLVNTKKNEKNLENENKPSTDTDFDLWWEAYPKKVGKLAASKAWNKVNDRPAIETMLSVLDQQKKSDQWTKDNGKYIPHPTTYINQGRWEDELVQPVSNKPEFTM